MTKQFQTDVFICKNGYSIEARKRSKSHFFKNYLLVSLLIAFIAFTNYLPSLFNGFVFDDIPAIINNKDVKSDRTYLYKIFFNDFWGIPIIKEESHKSYRPLTVLSFRWNYWIHDLYPFGFHLVNLILHSIVSALFYNFSLYFIDSRSSFFSGLLFAIHPVHVDAVASVVGRAEILSALFFITSLLYYCKKEKNEKSAFFVVLLTFFATFCKEQGSTAILVCLVHDIIFKLNLNRKISNLKIKMSLIKTDSKSNFTCNEHNNLKVTSKKTISSNKNIFMLVTGFLFISFIRLQIVKYKFPSFSKFDNPARNLASPYRQLNYAYLWTLNCWLLIYPSSLSCDWSSQSITNISSFFDSANFFTLIFIIIFILTVLKADSILFMGLAILVITFLPASNIFFPLGFVLAERVLYLPSMGFCIIIGYGIELIFFYLKCLNKSHLFKIIFKIGIVLLLTSHALKTFKRCYQWKDEYILFNSGLFVNPNNVKLLNNLGKLYENKGNFSIALTYYHKAISIHPDDVRGYLNLGNALTKLNRLSEAETSYRKAIGLVSKEINECENNRNKFDRKTKNLSLDNKLKHEFKNGVKKEIKVTQMHLQAFLNLASLISMDSSRIDEANLIFSNAAHLFPYYQVTYSTWFQSMLHTNRNVEEKFLSKVTQVSSQAYSDILYNFALLVHKKGNPKNALLLFDRVLSFDPYHEESLLTSARIIKDNQSLKDYEEVAIKRLEMIAFLGKADHTVYFDLGMLNIRKNQTEMAKKYFSEAIKIKPNFTQALFNMALLLYKEEKPLDALPFLEYLLKVFWKSSKT